MPLCDNYIRPLSRDEFRHCLREINNDSNRDLEKIYNEVSKTLKNMQEERVNHPSHYTWLKEKCGIEVIDITRHLDFDSGNAVKYILRAGHKKEAEISDLDKEIEDTKKAIWYLEDKVKMLENAQNSTKQNNS